MIRLLAATVCVLAAVAAGHSDGVRRTCYATYQAPVVYHAATYHAPAYAHVIAQPVEVYGSHAFSIDGYYRDKLLVDAITGRLKLLEIEKAKEQAQPARVPQPLPAGPAAEAASVRTAVPEKLAAIVQEKCIKCHNPAIPERADLSNLAAVPPGVRWHAHGLVNSSEMPKGGAQLEDAEVVAFYEWAKLGSKAIASARKAKD